MAQGPRAVFLSYASQDVEAARSICAALQAGGIEVWFDQSELRGGDAWDQRIRQQIRDCALFIPVVSANTRTRQEGYFRLEWRLADQRTHSMARNKAFIVPVSIDAAPDSSADTPESFSAVQWTRLPSGATPPAFVDHVLHLLSSEPKFSSGAFPSQQSAAPDPAAAPMPVAPNHAAPISTRYLLLALAVLAVMGSGYWVLNRLAQPKQSTSAPAPAATGQSGPSEQVSAPEKSIAVLPFLDMSEKKDQEYFSDGLTEELIDLLAKTPGLDVIARTSSFYFKGRQATIGEIATTLHVSNVIEGSVRKAGNTLRVTAQLIRARDGVHLWSETYDRDLKDVFQVQDDIAHGVVDKLKLTLLPGASDSAARTRSTDAYSLYLQGRYFLSRDSESDLSKAQNFFEQAVALDPGYAAAWASEGIVAARRIANGFVSMDLGFAQARTAASKALQLDPNNGDACAVRGNEFLMTMKWQEAESTLERCHRENPDNALVLLMSAVLARQLGRDSESLSLFHQILAHDPLNLLARRYLARALYHAGSLADAEAAIRHAIDINPAQPGVQYELGRILLAKGDQDAADTAFEAEAGVGWKRYGLALGCHSENRRAQSDSALADLLKHPAGSEFQIGETYAFCGDADRAFEWLDAAAKRDPGIIWLRNDPLLRPIASDPRYNTLLRRINLPPG
jgi:TolB-like protein/tetratricopeptide (TPR) repeat protein